MRFEKKRMLSGISFLFLICMTISTAYFGVQYAEEKIEDNTLRKSIERFEKNLREKQLQEEGLDTRLPEKIS